MFFSSKREAIAPQWAFKLHDTPAASDLAFNTPYKEGELSSYDNFFFFLAGILSKEA